MELNFYMDIIGKDHRSAQLISSAFSVAHRAMGEVSEGFALAFPSMKDSNGRQWVGNVIRVFSQSKESIDVLVRMLDSNEMTKEKLILTYPKVVPLDFDGNWIEYNRFRVPSRLDCEKSKSKGKINVRNQRMLDSEKKPYLRVLSKSTRQVFSIMIDKKLSIPCANFNPTKYGLSSKENPFALPDLPVR